MTGVLVVLLCENWKERLCIFLYRLLLLEALMEFRTDVISAGEETIKGRYSSMSDLSLVVAIWNLTVVWPDLAGWLPKQGSSIRAS